MTSAKQEAKTSYEVRRRVLASGPARCGVFRRAYDASIEDVWDACTDPERLRRWYAPVVGDLRPGGAFTQGDFGPGRVVRCEAPRLLTVELGGAVPATDEVVLRLREADGRTEMEFEHATTLQTHEIGGRVFDAVYCMGGGYGPRLLTLDQFLRGTLPTGLDPATLHLLADYQPAIAEAMARLDELIGLDRAAAPGERALR